jgi:hypothetical protein
MIRVASLSLFLLLGAPPQEEDVDAPREEGARTAFDVHKHGFNFTNRYPDGQLEIDVPGYKKVDVGDSDFGLCGGMISLALDTFYYDGSAPDQEQTGKGPASGTKLRSTIYERQLESFKGTWAIERVVAWSVRPIEDKWWVTGLRTLSGRKFRRKIAPAINRGHPVPLLLVKSDANDFLPDIDLSNPANSSLKPKGFLKNHQVLAIGYRRHKGAGFKDHWDIDIYDPNHPGEIHTLHLRQRTQNRKIREDGTVDNDHLHPGDNVLHRFRGLCASPYDKKRPYWIPDGSARKGLADLKVPPAAGPDREDGALTITHLDPGSGRVTAKDETGDVFRFKLEDPALVKHLKVGQSVMTDEDELDLLVPMDLAVGASEPSAKGAFDLKERKAGGRSTGRLIIDYPGDKGDRNTRFDIFLGETNCTGGYGATNVELLPGTYHVAINSKVMTGVVIQAGKDTELHVGLLVVQVDKSTRWDVHDADGKAVTGGYGAESVGLPPGEYRIHVKGAKEKLTIEKGKVTEF